MNTSTLGLISIAAVFGAFLILPGLRRWRERRLFAAGRITRQALIEARGGQRDDGADKRPLTQAEIEELQSWRADLALPGVRLEPAPDVASAPGGCRLGGPVWLAEGEVWPQDERGIPLEFVAQVDFAAMPSLPGYPTQGVLQFFVVREDLYGANFDAPLDGGARVIWRPSMDGGAMHQTPELVELAGVYGSDFSPLIDLRVREAGLPLAGIALECLPGPDVWQVDARLNELARRGGLDEITDEWADNSQPMAHHVGGHPSFTQYDFRKAGKFDEFDRVLLRLTSDDYVMWGDVGEAVFMIRSDDLAANDFSRVIFWWDCT